MHRANAFTMKLMTNIQETFRDFSPTVMMVTIATISMTMPFFKTIDMLLLLMLKSLLVHAAISMVPTKTVHSVNMVFGMVQDRMNIFMTISALVITPMANVKVKRKKAVAMTVLLMEPLIVSIELNLLTEFALSLHCRLCCRELCNRTRQKWYEETKLIKKKLFALFRPARID